MLTNLLLGSHSAAFLNTAQRHLPGDVPPTVGQALLHQSAIKKMPDSLTTGQSDGHGHLSVGVPSS